tara:strand:+ start:241 stop:423 length:183 start_codon:yes stop_codon:yes gene_type:complete
MTLTKELLKEQFLEFTNSKDDFIEVTTDRGRFQLWINGNIVKSTKYLKPIQEKLDYLLAK